MDLVVHAFGITDVGNRRRTNEDTWWAGQLGGASMSGEISPHAAAFRLAEAPVLALVSDGVGGANAGEVASELAVTSIASSLGGTRTTLRHATRAGLAIRAALDAADAAVRTAAAAPGRNGMCATISLLCFTAPDVAWWAQAGDSRIYRFRASQLDQLTRDHSPVGRLRQSGAITEAEARRHPQRNEIDQCVGDPVNPFAPDLGSFELQPADTYLLCSDGLSDGLWDHEIAPVLGAVRGPADVQTAAETLVAAAKRASGRDNITAIVLWIESLAAVRR